MKRANMAAADAAWFYKPKRGHYRCRSDVRFGTKQIKGKYRKWGVTLRSP
jgi:hypothetical protein